MLILCLAEVATLHLLGTSNDIKEVFCRNKPYIQGSRDCFPALTDSLNVKRPILAVCTGDANFGTDNEVEAWSLKMILYSNYYVGNQSIDYFIHYKHVPSKR